jgi:hypothetical protein
VTRAKRLGYTFDATSAGTLQKSFDAVEDKDAALCLNLLSRKALQRYVICLRRRRSGGTGGDC